MVSLKIAKSAASNVSLPTLKSSPVRLVAFLQAVAGDAAITKLFVTKLHWSKATAKEGWALLNDLSAVSVVTAPEAENPAIAAMDAAEAWQSTNLAQARAVLQVTHPEQAMFLFHDFATGRAMEAVHNVATFLLRRDQLAHAPERKPTRKADAEALAIIEQTGTTKQVVKELEAIVEAAQAGPELVDTASSDAELEAARIEALRKIHAWLTMWSDLARTVVKQRAQMIRLGIAKRRTKTKAVVVPPIVTPPAPPAPPPAPAADDNGPQSHAA